MNIEQSIKPSTAFSKLLELRNSTNIEQSLKPCPLCGKKVQISLYGDYELQCYKIHGKGRMSKENACSCKLFLESKPFDTESITDKELEKILNDLIKAWNRRA
jgi:ferredoxin-thioredoxin reductase catalytic subunit